ncbi:MAG: DegT/DnrJ/EryC1/StrS family aminotransferase [Actinomycetota bacterium]
MAQTLRLPSDLPAMLGGPPAFPEGVPLVRPSVPDIEGLTQDLRTILESRTLTNGSFVRELERRAAEYLGVRHCVAVASCTSGLMLLLRAADLSGDVIVPSFTFAATVHAVAWNGLRPVFADIDPSTLTLDPEAAGRVLGVRTSAILATHIFGTPCDVEGLAALAREHGIRLFFDAAHAFGSHRGGSPVGGFGDAEVFSLSPTKLLVAGEGGIIATNDDLLADRCRIGRDYGNPGDYDCLFVGLNARMSELHAALALRSLEGLEERVHRRNVLAESYRRRLAEIPGVSFPQVADGDRSTYKDFSILIEPEAFGLDASAAGRALAAEGIETRRYYSPPVHAMRAYSHLNGTNGRLRVTEEAAARALTLPLWSEMSDSEVFRVAGALDRIQEAAPRLGRMQQKSQREGSKEPTADGG